MSGVFAGNRGRVRITVALLSLQRPVAGPMRPSEHHEVTGKYGRQAVIQLVARRTAQIDFPRPFATAGSARLLDSRFRGSDG